MKAFVTGATGFVGHHIVRALLERGDEVACLVRPTSPRHNLEGLPVRTIPGDLTDASSLRPGIEGSDLVFHCAADYRLYVPDPEQMYAANVEGTRNVLSVAAESGVGRVVYTSTVGALGLRHDGAPSDETTPVTIDHMIGHYKRSKFLAERVAEEWAGKGLPVVIVNPSAPVGDHDVKPTATGRMILDFLRGKMRAYVDTGLNLIDVRDAAAGHLLAADKGEVGEKYILGNRNLTLKEIFDVLSGLTGIRSPRVRLPHWVPLIAAATNTAVARLRSSEPTLALDAVRLSRHRMFFDCSKAVRELGLPQTPVERALERAVSWFRAHGYVEEAVSA